MSELQLASPCRRLVRSQRCRKRSDAAAIAAVSELRGSPLTRTVPNLGFRSEAVEIGGLYMYLQDGDAPDPKEAQDLNKRTHVRPLS